MKLSPRSISLAALLVAGLPAALPAQGFGGSALPPLAPTGQTSNGGNQAVAGTSGVVAPLAAGSTTADRAGGRPHHAQVSCAAGQLEVRANNSSLNSILRAVAQCTGMKITGGVLDQRVFGNYGPAMPATVIATLLDGTGTNLLLRETATDQPAELILTPRTAGPTPPSPNQVADEDTDEAPAGNKANAQPSLQGMNGARMAANAAPGSGSGGGSGPVSIPQPINNINGSPNNTSPTAANYPVTHSVPLDSIPTPSTTPSTTGIVDAPNPPPAGSDTAALLNGQTTNMPGNTTITDQPTSGTTSPGGTNTTLGTLAPSSGTAGNQNGNNGSGTNGASGTSGTSGASGTLTPQQVYEQLQKLRQQAATPSQGQSTTPSAQPQ